MKIAIKITNMYLKKAIELKKDNSKMLTECGVEIKDTLAYKMNEIAAQIAFIKYEFFKQFI